MCCAVVDLCADPMIDLSSSWRAFRLELTWSVVLEKHKALLSMFLKPRRGCWVAAWCAVRASSKDTRRYTQRVTRSGAAPPAALALLSYVIYTISSAQQECPKPQVVPAFSCGDGSRHLGEPRLGGLCKGTRMHHCERRPRRPARPGTARDARLLRASACSLFNRATGRSSHLVGLPKADTA